jgi:hypothetical protein
MLKPIALVAFALALEGAFLLHALVAAPARSDGGANRAAASSKAHTAPPGSR